jgi:sporulation protein YlmC with PRC-barrel domain
MIVSCARLAGERVFDPRGEDAGRIERVMVDLASGRIAGVVLACGGVLGLGERLHTVSWERIRLDPAKRRLILEEDRQEA